jgi:hypothetical protein
MGPPPKDPFWDTLDDATPAAPRPSPVARAPQGATRIDPSSIITEPDFKRRAAPVSESSQPDYVPQEPPGSDPRIVTSSLRAPTDTPLTPAGTDLLTTFSNQAVMIADLLRERFARKIYGSAFYQLHIDDPSGPSTAGGLLARQPLSLLPQIDLAPAIVCGWVDVSRRDAQLRSYEIVVRRHQSRQGRALPISAEIYERFLDELMNTLFEGGIRVMLVVPDEQEAPPAPLPVPARRHPLRSFLGAVFFIALGFGLGWNSERLVPLLERVKPWIEQVPAWLEVAKRLLQKLWA